MLLFVSDHYGFAALFFQNNHCIIAFEGNKCVKIRRIKIVEIGEEEKEKKNIATIPWEGSQIDKVKFFFSCNFRGKRARSKKGK